MKIAERGERLSVPYPAPLPLPRPADGQTVYRLRRAAVGPGGALTVLCRDLRRAAVCRARGEDGLAAQLENRAEAARVHLGLLLRMLACCGAEPGFFAPQGGHKIWWSPAWAEGARKEELSLQGFLRESLADCARCRALVETLPPALVPCAERMLADHLHCVRGLQARLAEGASPV